MMQSHTSLHRISDPSLFQEHDKVHTLTARAALTALYQELCAYPKPGLVSLTDSGSHQDMDAMTFMRSLFSLRNYFRDITRAGAHAAGFDELQGLGLEAESHMLEATGNTNTHRGAIFTLGLLAAAAGFLSSTGQPLEGDALGHVVHERWGPPILRSVPSTPCSHGTFVASRYGAAGARQEAAAGFPHVFHIGLPTLSGCLSKGADFHSAVLQSFFGLMAVLPDTNLLFRGGARGLSWARTAAQSFLDKGGVYRENWREHALAIHHEMIARNLSPGGSADLLAATIFVRRLQGSLRRPQ
jgi:triphosphoribosyl-dephospho-CoA synthase